MRGVPFLVNTIREAYEQCKILRLLDSGAVNGVYHWKNNQGRCAHTETDGASWPRGSVDHCCTKSFVFFILRQFHKHVKE